MTDDDQTRVFPRLGRSLDVNLAPHNNHNKNNNNNGGNDDDEYVGSGFGGMHQLDCHPRHCPQPHHAPIHPTTEDRPIPAASINLDDDTDRTEVFNTPSTPRALLEELIANDSAEVGGDGDDDETVASARPRSLSAISDTRHAMIDGDDTLASMVSTGTGVSRHVIEAATITRFEVCHCGILIWWWQVACFFPSRWSL